MLREKSVGGSKTAPAGVYDMTSNLPPSVPHVFESEYRWAMQEVLERDDLARLFGSHAFAGTLRDREAGARFVAKRLAEIPDPDRVVITNSTQVALLSIIVKIVGLGGALVTDNVTYPSIGQFASLFGFKLLPMPIDDEGMDPEALRHVCKSHRPRALYATPTLQNPTTGIMSLDRRHAIAKVAREYNVTIIEDDIYSLLPTEQPPPMAAIAPDLTWFILGTTKGVAAGLKTCYVVAPSANAAAQTFWPGVRATYWMGAPANVSVVTRLIEEERIDRIISAVREETRTRQATIAEVMRGTRFRAHREGLHVWLELPKEVPGLEFVSVLEKLGTKVAPAELYSVAGSSHPNGIRFGTGKPANVAELGHHAAQIKTVYEQLVGC